MSEVNAIETEEKPILRGDKGYFLKGTAPGPGRPEGSKSIKDAVRQWLEDNPDDFEDFLSHFIKKNRELAWQMLEGKPPQKMEVEANTKHLHLHLTEKELKIIEEAEEKLRQLETNVSS